MIELYILIIYIPSYFPGENTNWKTTVTNTAEARRQHEHGQLLRVRHQKQYTRNVYRTQTAADTYIGIDVKLAFNKGIMW